MMEVFTAFILSLLCYMTVGEVSLSPSPASTQAPTQTATQAPTQAATQAPTQAATQAPPTLEFSCKNGKISNISGKDIVPSAIVIDNENGTMCHLTDTNCKYKGMKNTLHVIYDESGTKIDVVAGHHPFYYELKCKTGYVAKAFAKVITIGSTTPDYTRKVVLPTQESITITIFKGNTELTDAVDIGEQLSLRIKGPANSKILPINCTASDDKNSHPLWDSTTCSSKDEAIMDQSWTTTLNYISMNMYAFRFIDSINVKIECSVYVCPSSDLDCLKSATSCPKSAVQLHERRRRSKLESNKFNKNKRETSSVSYTVIDRYGGANGSEGVSGNISLFLTAILITMCFLGRK